MVDVGNLPAYRGGRACFAPCRSSGLLSRNPVRRFAQLFRPGLIPASGTARRARTERHRVALSLLHLRGIDIDVHLAGQLHQLIHDLVCHRPFDKPVAGHPVVPAEVQRSPEPDPRSGPQMRNKPPGRLNDIRVDHRARNDRHPRFQRHPSDAGLAPVEAAVGGPGPLGIDAQQVAFAKDSNTGVQSRLRRVGVLAVDRHLTNTPEESARQPPFQARRREVLRLGEEGHPPGHHYGHEERVAKRQVIAGENCGALTRHVIQPLRPRAPDRAQERADGDIFQETVEHGPPPLARPSHVTAPPQA